MCEYSLITNRPSPTRGGFAALRGSARGRAAQLKRYKHRRRFVMRLNYSTILLAAAFSVVLNAQADVHKQIVGATEVIHIEEANLSFIARVDTGAKTSSIHAKKIKVDPSDNPKGKPISFYLVNKKGQSKIIETQIASVATIKTSEGSERRYKVLLTLKWKNSKKSILVSLNDREKMEYGLLLGRNWLHKDFLVDVDRNNED